MRRLWQRLFPGRSETAAPAAGAPRQLPPHAQAAVPFLAPGVTLERGGSGALVVLVPRTWPGATRAARWLGLGDLPPKRVVLDGLGTKALDLVDGKRQVREIVAALAAAQGVTAEVAGAQVIVFFDALMTRGIIALEVRRGS